MYNNQFIYESESSDDIFLSIDSLSNFQSLMNGEPNFPSFDTVTPQNDVDHHHHQEDIFDDFKFGDDILDSFSQITEPTNNNYNKGCDQFLDDQDFSIFDTTISNELEQLQPASNFVISDNLQDMVNNLIPTSPNLSVSSSSTCNTIHSQDSVSTGSNRSSKFEASTLVEKKKRKKDKQKEERAVKKRCKKTQPLWNHNKFSESASYLEISSQVPTLNLQVEVFQTPRRQNGPLESDKDIIQKIGELSYTINNIDTSKTSYISLKSLLDKKAIYGDKKVSKVHTWIKITGTTDYLFLYCQTGKVSEVHNIISITDGSEVSTRSDNLSKFSGKCTSNVHFNGFYLL